MTPRSLELWGESRETDENIGRSVTRDATRLSTITTALSPPYLPIACHHVAHIPNGPCH